MLKALACLQTVIGIHSISPAIYSQGDFEQIQKSAMDLAKDVLEKGDTFGVRARRVGEHTFSSNDIAKTVGSNIIKELGDALGLKVDLGEPDKWIHINVRDKNIFVYSNSIQTPWEGNPIENFSEGAILLSQGVMSEFVSAMLLMKRGVHILPIVLTRNPAKNDLIRKILNHLKQYLPIRSFYYFKLNINDFEERITQFTANYEYRPLEFLVRRKFQLRLGEWMVEYHKKLFELIESQQKIDWNSNIASYMSNKQRKSYNGQRRKLNEYVSIVEGNYPISYYTPLIPVYEQIESSKIPIFRAAIALTKDEIKEKFAKLAILTEKEQDLIQDYPEIDEIHGSDLRLPPFTCEQRDDVPISISSNFDVFWRELEKYLESMMKDLNLYSEPTLLSLESLELIQL
jgi:hypothetical protein